MYPRVARVVISIFAVVAAAVVSRAETYVTEAVVQIDRCASAWFISRFIDAEANFVFFEAGTPQPAGISYAFHGADYFRVGAGCTFTELVRKRGLTQVQALRVIDGIANDTMAWRQGPGSIALAFRESVDALREATEGDHGTYEAIFPMFDLLYMAAGGTGAAVVPALRGHVDAVELSLWRKWMMSGDEEQRSSRTLKWEQLLRAKRLNSAKWIEESKKEGFQLEHFSILIEWADMEGSSQLSVIITQKTICKLIINSPIATIPVLSGDR